MSEELRAIGEFCTVRRGASPRPINNPDFFGGNVGWVRISDVTKSKKYLRKTSQYLSVLGESRSVRVDKGDLVMSICGTIGRPIIIDMPACIHDGFVQLYNFSSDSCIEYFYYLLQFHEKGLEGKGQPGTQINLNSTIVSKYRAFIPSRAEQEKIANILTAIDALIDLTSEEIKKFQNIRKSLMQDLFTNGIENNEFKSTSIGRIPENWEVVSLLKVAKIQNGQVDPKVEPYSKMFLIAPNHIESGEGRLLGLETSEQQGAISGKYLCPKGTVIYSKIRPRLMKVAIVNFECICSADMYPFLPSDNIDSEFLLNLLLSPRFTQFAISVSERSNIPKINRTELSEFKLGLPPLEEQKEIGKRLRAISDLIDKKEELLKKRLTIKKGLQQDLLTGKVRVN